MEEEHEMIMRKKEKEGNEYLRGRWDENGEIKADVRQKRRYFNSGKHQRFCSNYFSNSC
jgi:hypothetical protein